MKILLLGFDDNGASTLCKALSSKIPDSVEVNIVEVEPKTLMVPIKAPDLMDVDTYVLPNYVKPGKYSKRAYRKSNKVI